MEPNRTSTYEHVKLDDKYYGANLYSLLKALESIGFIGTGDWFGEFMFRLEYLRKDEDRPNIPTDILAEEIRRLVKSKT